MPSVSSGKTNNLSDVVALTEFAAQTTYYFDWRGGALIRIFFSNANSF